MLPLHAIPTEVIRKGFRPVRGFSIDLSINFANEERPLLYYINRPQSALSKEKMAEFALDLTPVFEPFARLFGYDLQLLKAGGGECGVEGHDWNLYGTKDRMPQVVRWRGFGGGEALLCIGLVDLFDASARVLGLADRIMAPQMAKAFEAIGELSRKKAPTSVDQPTGNLLEKVAIEKDYFHGSAFAGAYWYEPQGDQLTPQQEQDIAQLRNSCWFFRERPKVTTNGGLPVTNDAPGQRTIVIGQENPLPITLRPEEPTPAALIEQLQAQASAAVEEQMQVMLAKVFETRGERVHRFLLREDLSVTVGNLEESERALALAYFIKRGEAKMFMLPSTFPRQTTFSREFQQTPAKTLLGTHATKKLHGGHVMPGADLIEMLLAKVHEEASEVLSGSTKGFALQGRVIMSDDLAMQINDESAYAKAYKLEKPYTALYRGLPIRVMDTYVVSHGDGSEGLACDYYIDHQNQAVHFVSLYRVKANKPRGE